MRQVGKAVVGKRLPTPSRPAAGVLEVEHEHIRKDGLVAFDGAEILVQFEESGEVFLKHGVRFRLASVQLVQLLRPGLPMVSLLGGDEGQFGV